MNDAERLLIEYICDGDIKKSQAQVRTILESLNTEKDKRFKEYQLKKLNTKQGENILEREKYWIQKKYKENPAKSLNIMQTAGLAEDTQ